MSESRSELIAWVNDLLRLNYTKVEQLGTGAAYAQIMDSIYGDLPMSRVKFGTKHEYEYLANYKVLQNCFISHKVDKIIPTDRLMKCKMQDNLEFLQWLKKFWDRNFPGDVYDAVARRGAANEPAAANRSTNTPVRRAMHNNGGANRSMSGRLTAGNTSLRGPSPDHTAILNLQKELQEERTTVAALEKERDFYFGKLRDVELLIQQELERSPDSAESPLLKEIQAVLYSTEGILEKIADIEKEISKTQKNKATEYHLGLLKAKLAKYRVQLLDPGKTAAKGEGFDVMKSGDARVALIGFPSVGKSTLLNKLTNTHSEACAYEFTTLTCIPGKIEYNGANIQLLDLPGIIEGAAQGKGRGRQVIAVARTADLIMIMLDATKSVTQRELLEAELEAVGIRLNTQRPNVYFKIKTGGGISINATCKLTTLTEKMVHHILHDYRIFNAEVLIREDITVDQFIDVVLGNRKYIQCIYCYNKIDSITIEQVDELARTPNTVVMSCEMDLNTDYLVETIWKNLNLLRVYTKKRGEYPDFEGGLIIRSGSTIEHVCHAIHRSLVAEFKYALVWGRSTKHNPQRVGLSHLVENEDVIQVVKRR